MAGLVVFLILAAIFGIAIFFDKTILPEIQSPILRCLVAPAAGAVVLLGYWFLQSVAEGALQAIWALMRWAIRTVYVFLSWLTSRKVIVPLSVLVLLGGAMSALFGWLSLPLSPLWASAAGITLGAISGNILLNICRSRPSDSWLQLAFFIPPAITYWVTSRLGTDFKPWWIQVTTALTVVLFIRFLLEER